MKKKISTTLTKLGILPEQEAEVKLSLSFSLLKFDNDGKEEEPDQFGYYRIQTEWSNGTNSILPIDGWINDGRSNAIKAVNTFFDYVDQQRENVGNVR